MKTHNLDAIVELARHDPTVNRAVNTAGLYFERWGQREIHVADLQAYAESLELAVISLAAGNASLSKSLTDILLRMPPAPVPGYRS